MSSLQTKLLIDGNWIAAQNGETFDVTNPATGELIAKVAKADAADAEAAVAAAYAAFDAWARRPAVERARILRTAYQLLLDEADDIAARVTQEQGKPLQEAKSEVLAGAEDVLWYAEEGRRVYGDTIPSASGTTRVIVLREPVGVVGAITPWNFPAAMVTRKIAPALAAGCTVVLKPAEQTPLTALQIADVFQRAGLPQGVLNVVPTDQPAAVGDVLLGDRRVRKISFTGSTAVGKHLLNRASEQVKRVSLELGGHAPFIVFGDADIDQAVNAAVGSAFTNAGQTCVSANRIYVEESIMDEFVDRFAARVKALRIGPGDSPDTDVGPVIDEAAREKVQAHVADAVGRGAVAAAGGAPVTDGSFARGWFFEPTVLANVTDEMAIACDETFGPVAPVMPFRAEDEVIARANDTPYGLAAYVFTKDLGRAIRVGERLEYGMIGINRNRMGGPQAPFGGIKQGGLGREGGYQGIDAYLEYKQLAIEM